MDDHGENPPAVPPKTGTVQDVRPRPPLDPKDLPKWFRKTAEKLNRFLATPQKGRLEDILTKEQKTFKANLDPPLKINEHVRYKDLANDPYDAQVTGRP
jgi:hypothetical protein